MTTTTVETRTLDVPGATLTYDVRGPLPTADGAPPLLLIGQPMDAAGFTTLASFFTDRTVVTYDPRGLGRSTRSDASLVQTPEQQADDVHRLVAELGAGPVDLLGSSGGAVTALRLAATFPDDVRTVVAHEPPALPLLPDADRAFGAWGRVQMTYNERGWGWGMAAFIAMTSWQGEFPEGFGTESPDPAMFGMPTEDDGSRDDPLLSDVASAIVRYQPDIAALQGSSARIVPAAGIESKGTMTWRTSESLAAQLGVDLAVFPSNHGGFMGGEYGQTGEPEAFAATLREVLAG
ncbi:Alpha/beta hydrolase family protein [Georgenia satyanarayanai]|uniref:Alpha/beta hydrolase family protein n=1 Tax=Georgenia satyanarayanai TaxID=860221 RepID=A0A2Y9ALD4_9MICO|nr:alpha/beta hydrolase [Georgenia satyanarayanai]PYF99325.1 alpha/beta hydrolase family protein [Georgenia satyanarayanai]SSA43137.1 Alpha/beta hydrolase family protein [Georgenia satyanarayanai]